MTDVASLLPNNSAAAERDLEQATARVGDIPLPIRSLWNPEDCPASLLPWLAWALSVDTWEPGWSDATKRQVIAASVEVHRRKGTRASVLRALEAAGYGDAELVEFFSPETYNAANDHDGVIDHERPDEWAEYRLILRRPVSVAQADQVRKILSIVAPLRSHLVALDFTQALNLYDGASLYDGTFTHGVT